MTRPNILFLMTDQMQGRVLDPGHPCLTPNLDRLAGRGIRFENAYTTNAICSPARAGIMTGLLPHNHGVITVTHLTDDDQCNLRTKFPHWAQRLVKNGYRTGYFGKWHVERTNDLVPFGWQVDRNEDHPEVRAARKADPALKREAVYSLAQYYDTPGYKPSIFYGVCDIPPEQRRMGLNTTAALGFIDTVIQGADPWCAFVSVPEPHDPFICGQEAFDQYDVDTLELPSSLHDELNGRPGIYRKAAQVWKDMTDREHREAAACYYASITEIDAQFGRIIDRLEQAGVLDNTLVIMTADHGELLGAHGLYCKNLTGAEEIYNIPLVIAGPGIPAGITTHARVGSHDLCPTLLELAGCEPVSYPDSRSFVPVLRDPMQQEKKFTTGYAEYFGGRFWTTQRIAWKGDWKFCFNGFDFDELYNLAADPYEMNNLAQGPGHARKVKEMMAFIWERVKATNDHSLLNSHYPILRLAPFGPLINEEED